MLSKRPDKLRALEAPFILFIAPIILTIWMYYGRQTGLERLFSVRLPDQGKRDLYSAVYEYLVAFLLMFCIPVLVEKAVFSKSLRDYGIQLGDARTGFRIVVIVVPILLCAAWLGSLDAAMQVEYPLAKSTMQCASLFLTAETFHLLYYLGWEFFFRGLMLFGLESEYGAVAAILIQTIPSAILHVDKPPSEGFAAIFAGLVFGYVALRTRSILYPFILHATVGLGLDVFATLRLT